MSYATHEVLLRDGRVIPRDGEALPQTARALLVVLDGNLPRKESRDLASVLDIIRARQAARGHVPPSAEIVNQQVRSERDSWD